MRPVFTLLASLIALFGLATAAHAQAAGAIDFGDNTSGFANNGECDDPRFTGEGMAAILLDSDRMHDAADCAAALKAGKITYPPLPSYEGEGAPPTIDEIDFGDDESQFANNGSCDDSRFGGRTMASILIDPDIRHDASDCRKGMEQGDLVFVREADAVPASAEVEDGRQGGGRVDLSGIDFGDNESPFALNNECDDSRFEGEAMASFLIESDVGHDASDCALAVIDGEASFRSDAGRGADSAQGIDFGDDASEYSFNLECDDPRFEGEGMAEILLEEDVGHDASDCRAALDEGQIEFVGGA